MPPAGIVHPLSPGALDIIGDIHGEIDALDRLLAKLGYADGRVPNGRKLVFVGDLIDRGPDSPAVIRRVQQLIEAGAAQAIVGNHELNALRDDPDKHREGEDWWYGRETPDVRSVVSGAEKAALKQFLASLPLALARPDLRIVHACWDDDTFRRVANHATVLDAFRSFDDAADADYPRLAAAAAQELASHQWTEPQLADHFLEGTHDDGKPKQLRSLPALAARDEHKQMGNPIRIATSGKETAGVNPFYASGKWRVVARQRWWDH